MADDFNVANKVYAAPQPVAEYIDSSLAKEALGKYGWAPSGTLLRPEATL